MPLKQSASKRSSRNRTRRASFRPLYTGRDVRRFGPEPLDTEKYRTPWRHDYARLVHSPSFRRLQGKTQLFPGESDFFRNRLTHSIEVAQIAKSIAIKINARHLQRRIPPGARGTPAEKNYLICEDLVEVAALAHDLGHPPFGHQGEIALDQCLAAAGGFEGNAQTLRILARVEKKRITKGDMEFDGKKDLRCGLNLTYRTLASVLKYDHEIATRPEGSKVDKGFYAEEKNLVRDIKQAVTGVEDFKGEFKTVECQIMDIADDIAYSTYDFEDAMKAGFTSVLDVLRLANQKKLLRRIAVQVWKRLNGRRDAFDEDNIPKEILPDIEQTEWEILAELYIICFELVPTPAEAKPIISGLRREMRAKFGDRVEKWTRPFIRDLSAIAIGYDAAQKLRSNGYLRARFTSDLVSMCIDGVRFRYNAEYPALSKVYLDAPAKRRIEILKIYTYEAHVEAARLKTIEFRGRELLATIFKHLKNDQKNELLPDDWRTRVVAGDERHRLRCIGDFIAGMTDRYAIEFWQRLTSGPSITVFKDV
jgi:dGTPase